MNWKQRIPLILVGAIALLALIESWTCGLVIKRCSDSGWVKLDNSITRTVQFKHDLGVVPARVDAWFSPNEAGTPAYAIQYRWSVSESGSPVNIFADSSDVHFDIFNGVPLRGVWNGKTQNWTLHKDGYIRIVTSR